MIKFLVPALLVAATAAPALAEPVATSSTINAGGIEVAVVDTVDGASRTIVGHEVKTGRAFKLRIVNGRVNGVYDGMPVSYRLPKAKAAPVLTASR